MLLPKGRARRPCSWLAPGSSSRQSEVKPDGESQSVCCSTRALDTRAKVSPGVYLLVPCRILQRFIGKVLCVGFVDGFLIHGAKSHYLCHLSSLSTIAPQRRFATRLAAAQIAHLGEEAHLHNGAFRAETARYEGELPHQDVLFGLVIGVGWMRFAFMVN